MRATVHISWVVGTAVLIGLALACGGGGGGAYIGSTGEGPRGPSSLANTQWKAHSGQTYTFDHDGTSVKAGRAEGTFSAGHLDLAGSWRWEQHDSCTATLIGDTESRRLSRHFPKCSPPQRSPHPGWEHSRWDVGRSQLWFQPDGKVLWNGNGLHEGTWATSGKNATIDVIDKKSTLHRLDGCHAYIDWGPDASFKAKRSFPPCRDDEVTYGGTEWTTWDGDKLQLRFHPGGKVFKHRSDEGTWTRSADHVTATFGSQIYELDLLGDCAVAVLYKDYRFRMTRSWPMCP